MDTKLGTLIMTGLILGLSACTWVKLTPEGTDVRVVPADRVKDCKHLGVTTSFTRFKIAGATRNQAKISEELENLARNTAAEAGGDTISPKSPPEEGKQEFDMYRCRR